MLEAIRKDQRLQSAAVVGIIAIIIFAIFSAFRVGSVVTRSWVTNIMTLLFALAAGTLRTALWILGVFTALAVLGGTVPEFLAGTFFPALEGWSFLDWFVDAALGWPGPFEVLTGSWMLVDV